MLKIEVYTLHPTKEQWLKDALMEYTKRLAPIMQIKFNYAHDNIELLKLLKREKRLMALDVAGRVMASEDFAKVIERELERGGSRCVIVIGGQEGLPKGLENIVEGFFNPLLDIKTRFPFLPDQKDSIHLFLMMHKTTSIREIFIASTTLHGKKREEVKDELLKLATAILPSSQDSFLIEKIIQELIDTAMNKAIQLVYEKHKKDPLEEIKKRVEKTLHNICALAPFDATAVERYHEGFLLKGTGSTG